jgi:hypothetical protein
MVQSTADLQSTAVEKIKKSFSRHSELVPISVLDNIATADNRTSNNTANNQLCNTTMTCRINKVEDARKRIEERKAQHDENTNGEASTSNEEDDQELEDESIAAKSKAANLSSRKNQFWRNFSSLMTK